MEIIMYILVFFMGTVFGSFFTLATYRIPLKKDITHERSFCPNCNHKLGFFDMLPIFSYLLLGGKCRYCKEKIKIKYLLLEVLSGIVFLVSYISMNFNFPFYSVQKVAYFIAFILFYTVIVIVSCIDKEKRKITKSVLIFGIIVQFIYMVYLYVTKGIGMYRYSIYLILIILLFLYDYVIKKKENKSNYILEILYYSIYINMFIEPILFVLIVLLSLLMILWDRVYQAIKTNANLQSIDSKDVGKIKVRIGFYLGISTIIIVIIQNFTCYWG